METIYRKEMKYQISYAEKEMLISRLSAMLLPDTHANTDGCYTVRTLYFDDVNDTALMQSITGHPQKMKYRIRMYNGDPSFIRLEKKIKHFSGSYKTGEVISQEDSSRILHGDYEFLLQKQSSFLNSCYIDFTSRLLRPKIVLQYVRHAFLCPQDAIRITIDEGVSACSIPDAFFEPPTFFGSSVFENRQCVLEIKSTRYIPDYIAPLIGVLNTSRVSTSKYVAGRLFN